MKPAILIVDDNPKNIQLAATVIRGETQYEVYFAQSGFKALEILEKNQISLVLLDVMMPQMDGYETALKIIKNPKTADIPIIFLTANVSEEALVRAFECGAKDFITKPFNKYELLSRVKTHVELYNSREHLKFLAQNSINLLEQYKKIIDSSSIVSKTDKKGNITYVNELFCDVSEFSQEELVGKPHNIVRHPNTPKDIFRQMWSELKLGKTWNGIIQNRTKSGKSYYVDTVIMPICNEFGETEEYISARRDITELIELQNQIQDTQSEVVERLGNVIEMRFKEAGEHVGRVAEVSYILALKYGLSEKEALLLKQASPMHDVGKVAIPDSVLLKPAALTKEEFEIVKTHTTIGRNIFGNSNKEILKTSAIIAYEHHEKWNGEGYPRGISGENIHIFGRITSVADVFDALSYDRVYKKAWGRGEVLSYLEEQKNISFEPKIVDLLLENIEYIDRRLKILNDAAANATIATI